MIMNKLKVIDIGHSNLSIDAAMLDLETKISQLNFEGDYKVVIWYKRQEKAILKFKFYDELIIQKI